MNGSTLTRRLQSLLNEISSSSFMSLHDSYDFLYDAVKDFNYRTHYQVATQTLSIVAGTSSYNLNPDFVGLALMDRDNRNYIKWTYGGSDSFIFGDTYQNIVIEDNTSTSTIPSSWAITTIDQDVSMSNISGSASATAGIQDGVCTLYDTVTSPFANVNIGDAVFNKTDSSSGVVTSIISSSRIECAILDGTNNFFTASDSYIVIPQNRYKIVFNQIPSATATATIVYIKRPNPVYSLYQTYQLPPDAELPIVQFAAFLYKYKDREPNYGDALFKYYDAFSRRVAAEIRRGNTEKSGFRVNMRKLSPRSRVLGGYTR